MKPKPDPTFNTTVTVTVPCFLNSNRVIKQGIISLSLNIRIRPDPDTVIMCMVYFLNLYLILIAQLKLNVFYRGFIRGLN